MEKVVIIGARGMLGSELMRVFSKDEKYDVVGLDLEKIDITDKKQVDLMMIKERPEIVINAAAYNAVDKVEENDEEYEKAKLANGQAPKFLAIVAKKRNVIFVQYITDYIFDGKKREYVEEDLPSPISRYGESKALGEKNVKNIGGNYYLVRISKLFGKPGTSKVAKKSFFEIMLALAKKRKSIKVVDSEMSCFTYAPDLAKATKKLIEDRYAFGIYHLTNENPVTWYGGVETLFKLAKIKNVNVLPVSSREFVRLAKRPSSSILLNTKFPKLRSYEEALKEWLTNA